MKNYALLEIESFRKYIINKENKYYIKAFYWFLKHRYYENKEF